MDTNVRCSTCTEDRAHRELMDDYALERDCRCAEPIQLGPSPEVCRELIADLDRERSLSKSEARAAGVIGLLILMAVLRLVDRPQCDAHAVVLKGTAADCAVERPSDQRGESR